MDVFENDKFDVLKLTVDKSNLIPYRKIFINKYKNTQTYPEYHAHITVAYLEKGKGKKYINKNINKKFYCDTMKYGQPNGNKQFIKLK